MIDKIVEVGIMFDFYGKLLSQKQKIAIELYYIHDLSLAEIGNELNISRQGVYDLLKRGERNLYKYEENLELVKKFYGIHENIKEIIKLAGEIKDIDKKDIDKIKLRADSIYNFGLKILEKNREEAN